MGTTSNLVLVHGAWHGGWVWDDVAQRLRANGFTAIAPTLTGLGERSAELTPQIDLHTHARDIIDAARALQGPVTLIGHSYGGAVISQAATELGEQLAGLVYLDAVVPLDGETVTGPLGATAYNGFQAWANALGDGWRLPPQDFLFDQWGITEQSHRDAISSRWCDQPLSTFITPLRLPSTVPTGIPLTYIRATGREHSPVAVYIERVRALGMTMIDIPTGHEPMITHPTLVADVLGETLMASTAPPLRH